MNEANIVPGLQILNATLAADNNSVEVQMGDVVSQETENYTAQWVQHTGFCSLPPNAVPNKSASEGIMLKRTDRDYVFASRDVASQANYGNLKAGEATVYACGPDGTGQARMMCKADGSVNLYTTDDNTAGGKGVYFQVSPQGFFMMAPWGKFVFDATGFHMKTASGASFDLGALALPGPLSSLGTFARITAATVTLDSAGIMLGPPGVYFPAAYGPLAGMPVPPFASLGSSSVFVGV